MGDVTTIYVYENPDFPSSPTPDAGFRILELPPDIAAVLSSSGYQPVLVAPGIYMSVRQSSSYTVHPSQIRLIVEPGLETAVIVLLNDDGTLNDIEIGEGTPTSLFHIVPSPPTRAALFQGVFPIRIPAKSEYGPIDVFQRGGPNGAWSATFHIDYPYLYSARIGDYDSEVAVGYWFLYKNLRVEKWKTGLETSDSNYNYEVAPYDWEGTLNRKIYGTNREKAAVISKTDLSVFDFYNGLWMEGDDQFLYLFTVVALGDPNSCGPEAPKLLKISKGTLQVTNSVDLQGDYYNYGSTNYWPNPTICILDKYIFLMYLFVNRAVAGECNVGQRNLYVYLLNKSDLSVADSAEVQTDGNNSLFWTFEYGGGGYFKASPDNPDEGEFVFYSYDDSSSSGLVLGHVSSGQITIDDSQVFSLDLGDTVSKAVFF